jgi:hypothetical protein
MKYSIVLFILFFTIKVSYAQNIIVPKERGMIDNIQAVKPKTLKGNFPQAQFLYNTDKGKVYALPQDKMPCLVPHTNSNMPIAKLGMNEFKKIPNALPEQKLIPGNNILELQEKNK